MHILSFIKWYHIINGSAVNKSTNCGAKGGLEYLLCLWLSKHFQLSSLALNHNLVEIMISQQQILVTLIFDWLLNIVLSTNWRLKPEFRSNSMSFFFTMYKKSDQYTSQVLRSISQQLQLMNILSNSDCSVISSWDMAELAKWVFYWS